MVLEIETSVGDDVWMQGNTRHCETNGRFVDVLGDVIFVLALPVSISPQFLEPKALAS